MLTRGFTAKLWQRAAPDYFRQAAADGVHAAVLVCFVKVIENIACSVQVLRERTKNRPRTVMQQTRCGSAEERKNAHLDVVFRQFVSICREETSALLLWLTSAFCAAAFRKITMAFAEPWLGGFMVVKRRRLPGNRTGVCWRRGSGWQAAALRHAAGFTI